MILNSKILLLPSIVLLIGTLFGASATNAFADDPFKKIADDLFKNVPDDPFKNVWGIKDHRLPIGSVDKTTIFSDVHLD